MDKKFGSCVPPKLLVVVILRARLVFSFIKVWLILCQSPYWGTTWHLMHLWYGTMYSFVHMLLICKISDHNYQIGPLLYIIKFFPYFDSFTLLAPNSTWTTTLTHTLFWLTSDFVPSTLHASMFGYISPFFNNFISFLLLELTFIE